MTSVPCLAAVRRSRLVFVMSRLSPLMTRIWPLCCYVEPFGVVGVLEVELFTVEDFAGDAELEEAVRGGGELTVDWGLPGLLQDGGVVGTHGQLEAVREQERDQSGDWFALVFPKAHDLVQGVGQNRDHPGVAGGGFPGQNHTGCDWMKFVRCPGCLLNSQGWTTALAVADVIGEGDVFAPVGEMLCVISTMRERGSPGESWRRQAPHVLAKSAAVVTYCVVSLPLKDIRRPSHATLPVMGMRVTCFLHLSIRLSRTNRGTWCRDRLWPDAPASYRHTDRLLLGNSQKSLRRNSPHPSGSSPALSAPSATPHGRCPHGSRRWMCSGWLQGAPGSM
jgi:hypothetical protein